MQETKIQNFCYRKNVKVPIIKDLLCSRTLLKVFSEMSSLQQPTEHRYRPPPLTDKKTGAGWASPRPWSWALTALGFEFWAKWSPGQDSSLRVLNSAPPAASILLTLSHKLDRKVWVIHTQYMSRPWIASEQTLDGVQSYGVYPVQPCVLGLAMNLLKTRDSAPQCLHV